MQVLKLKNAFEKIIVCFLISISAVSFAQRKPLILALDTINKKDLSVNLKAGEYHLITKGKTPFIFTEALKTERTQENVALSFEYFCPKGLDFFKIQFGKKGSVRTLTSIGVAEGWVTFSIDLTDDLKNWGKTGDQLRFDLGSNANVEIQIRNLELRKPTEREKEIAANREQKQKSEAAMDINLKKYLSATYGAQITDVNVSEKEIIISGKTPQITNIFLAEVTPYDDVTEMTIFKNCIPIKQKNFTIKLSRIQNENGFSYDRLLSKWVLVKKTDKGFELISHAHYPDEIYAINNLEKEVATSRKGLGGFSVNRGHLSDLEDLDITSATVNVWFSRFMYSTPSVDRIPHTYNGKTYYFDRKAIAGFDATFTATAQRGIITAAILLVDKIEKSADPSIGKLLQHPDMDPAGIYSMPNMTNPQSVNCYAAVLDFFASRYSRPDKKYGRCNHWIMHNEVDAGWVWTNMGDKPASVFMDAYVKSMRMCYAIARQYNPHSEVFVSLTHYWALKYSPQFYPSKDLMEILLQYTKDEGDFKWAMAQHPYPQDLFEPKTWNDEQVDFTFNTPLITFKNIEVLDAWIKKPEVLYQGKTKRTLWLSENGTNSRTYSEKDLAEQAAGFAYAWKKIEKLSGIDGFQWHNWLDNRNEGGLRIGLRRFPDDEKDPGGKKPVWEVYKAADTKNEDAVFDQYKVVIGIKNWSEVNYTLPIK